MKRFRTTTMLHGPSAMAAGVQPLKYGAKELDRQAGLDLYDSRARQLNPLLGRTTTQDPLAEKYSGLSPYLWCAGNPVRFTDPTGRIVEYDMTDKELDDFSDMLNKLRKSQAFDKFFSELENNPNVTFVIKYDKTSESGMSNTNESVLGQYSPKTKEVAFLKGYSPSFVTIAEELYHAYQDMNGTLENAQENVEYEAKVATIISCNEAETPLPHAFKGIEEVFFDVLTGSDFENGTVPRDEFRSVYIKEGQKFVNFHKQYNSNRYYSNPVTMFPNTLLKILKLR